MIYEWVWNERWVSLRSTQPTPTARPFLTKRRVGTASSCPRGAGVIKKGGQRFAVAHLTQGHNLIHISLLFRSFLESRFQPGPRAPFLLSLPVAWRPGIGMPGRAACKCPGVIKKDPGVACPVGFVAVFSLLLSAPLETPSSRTKGKTRQEAGMAEDR